MTRLRTDHSSSLSERTARAEIDKSEIELEAALADYLDVDLSWLDPFPSDSGWTLAPDALRFISKLVAHSKPTHILEFGSGLSTRVFARACASLDEPCAVTSVDNDPEFSEQTRQHLIDDRVDCSVQSLVAPLVLRRHSSHANRSLPVYHFQESDLTTREPADVILVDGPPGQLGGREGILYQAFDYSRIGTLILLDDANREEESQIVERWQRDLSANIRVRRLDGFTKGLAAITVMRSPVVASKSEQTR